VTHMRARERERGIICSGTVRAPLSFFTLVGALPDSFLLSERDIGIPLVSEFVDAGIA